MFILERLSLHSGTVCCRPVICCRVSLTCQSSWRIDLPVEILKDFVQRMDFSFRLWPQCLQCVVSIIKTNLIFSSKSIWWLVVFCWMWFANVGCLSAVMLWCSMSQNIVCSEHRNLMKCETGLNLFFYQLLWFKTSNTGLLWYVLMSWYGSESNKHLLNNKLSIIN